MSRPEVEARTAINEGLAEGAGADSPDGNGKGSIAKKQFAPLTFTLGEAVEMHRRLMAGLAVSHTATEPRRKELEG